MSDSNSPQKTFDNIVKASRTNMPALEKALSEIDKHNDNDKKAIIDALEKFTIRKFINGDTGTPSEKDWAMVEGLMELGSQLFGDDLIDEMSGNDTFEQHSLLAMAYKVATEKRGKTPQILRDLLDEAAKLSDDDYNSSTKLAKTFMKVAKKHSSLGNIKPNRPRNPYRGPNS